ncbi:hypothetical protein C1H70_05945 [Halomonas urumqiensis]|uniref:Uncharacterized protein n=1 Tax=Halomonas urumqiensis TaxID=1684789 RepID=A0A2N7ULI3_9GAMM|nr:hypothetical protein [Halomonas urumqiensis]PMR81249.1 hypothetical protein C1H70_05945 [Halomonas urumqiensis]GHE22164.1 hypothetical protein GCM10017767_26850 [Halomonas urumqiensis]
MADDRADDEKTAFYQPRTGDPSVSTSAPVLANRQLRHSQETIHEKKGAPATRRAHNHSYDSNSRFMVPADAKKFKHSFHD